MSDVTPSEKSVTPASRSSASHGRTVDSRGNRIPGGPVEPLGVRWHDAFYGVAVIVWVIALLGGVVLGNVFAIAPDSYYDDATFNWGAAAGVWIGGFLHGLIFLGLGRVIELLDKAEKK